MCICCRWRLCNYFTFLVFCQTSGNGIWYCLNRPNRCSLTLEKNQTPWETCTRKGENRPILKSWENYIRSVYRTLRDTSCFSWNSWVTGKFSQLPPKLHPCTPASTRLPPGHQERPRVSSTVSPTGQLGWVSSGTRSAAALWPNLRRWVFHPSRGIMGKTVDLLVWHSKGSYDLIKMCTYF